MLQRKALVLAAGFCLTAGSARADFAPLAAGRTWEYRGGFILSAVTSYPGLSAREALSLEVLSERQAGDTVFYRVRMRDSLYDRKEKASATSDYATRPDTVLAQVRVFASVGDRVLLLPAASDSGILAVPASLEFRPSSYSFLGNLGMFLAHAALPDIPSQVPGGPAGLMETTAARSGYEKAWYLDGVGAVWVRHRLSASSMCGPTLARDLYLEEFGGNPFMPGIDPPPPALSKDAKDAKSFCSAIRARNRGRLVFAKARWIGTVDVSGRIIEADQAPAAQWPRATAAW